MNSLEFIEKEIEYLKFILEQDDVLQSFTDKDYKKLKDILQTLQQIKAELEVMELIKNGWSSMEQTLSSEKIIKFGKLNLDDWLKVWKTLEKFAFEKALEVENNYEEKNE